jgi:hypothetical protein
MSYAISTLLLRNLDDVFGESDPVRRRKAIDDSRYRAIGALIGGQAEVLSYLGKGGRTAPA